MARGKDAGAEKRPNTTSGGSMGVAALVFLGATLVAPVLAALKWDTFGRSIWFVAVGAFISLVAFVSTWLDKCRAESGAWRVPENVLHLLELLGGWPGSFVAQRLFRHKTSKVSYQIVFWLIVAAHELVAVDFLLGWRMAQALKAAAGL